MTLQKTVYSNIQQTNTTYRWISLQFVCDTFVMHLLNVTGLGDLYCGEIVLYFRERQACCASWIRTLIAPLSLSPDPAELKISVIWHSLSQIYAPNCVCTHIDRHLLIWDNISHYMPICIILIKPNIKHFRVKASTYDGKNRCASVWNCDSVRKRDFICLFQTVWWGAEQQSSVITEGNKAH